jgi:2'-5' RNA ligase
MRVAVVAYPLIDPDDAREIESFRVSHDPHAEVIAAHFTLVFPLEADEQALAVELRRIAHSAAPIDFRLANVAVSAGIDGRGYVSLEPDTGRLEIDDLHARLYAGMLEPDLRRDVPFVPHVTVGSNEDIAACHVAAGLLREGWSPVSGRIEELSLLDLSDVQPAVLGVFDLTGREVRQAHPADGVSYTRTRSARPPLMR